MREILVLSQREGRKPFLILIPLSTTNKYKFSYSCTPFFQGEPFQDDLKNLSFMFRLHFLWRAYFSLRLLTCVFFHDRPFVCVVYAFLMKRYMASFLYEIRKTPVPLPGRYISCSVFIYLSTIRRIVLFLYKNICLVNYIFSCSFYVPLPAFKVWVLVSFNGVFIKLQMYLRLFSKME